MTIFLRIQLIALVVLSSARIGYGQVKFTTIASTQEIGRGEYLQVEFVVENAKQIDQLTPPDFPGFTIAQGPIQSSGMSIVNGNMSQYKAISYVLQPNKTGKFTIGGASAMVDGKHMQSNTVTITVTAASTGASGGTGAGSGGAGGNGLPGNSFPGGGGFPFNFPDDARGADVDKDYILKPGENIREKVKKNMFVKVQVDKTTCYVGEPIVATYKLYSRLSSESRVTKRPSLNGFSVYDMVDPSQDAASVEKVNGKPFTVHIIRKTQLIPLQAGSIDLDPVEVENTVHFVKAGNREARRSSGNSLRDLFDQLSDDNNLGPEVEENVTLDTKPLTITVKPLPEDKKPLLYTGAVGSFTVQASLGNRTMAAKDEMTLHVVVRGKGNLPVINAPQIEWPAGIEAFDPKAKEDVNKTVAPMSGTKTFDYVFTPSNPGQYTIPAITLAYFDPASQSYKTASSDSLALQVTPSANRPSSPTVSASDKPAQIQQGGTGSWVNWFASHLEWVLAVVLLSVLAVYLYRQNRNLRKKEKELEAAREAAAKKEAELLEQQARQAIPPSVYTPVPEDLLAESRKLFEEGDYKGFYREVNRAVWKAVTRKLELPASEMNKFNVIRQLEQKGWGTDTTMLFEGILNECEMNLYTPAYDTYNMQQLLSQAATLLDKLAVKS